ncbi:MAG: OB-fold nucleic acid binding domain-containing protein, partial [Solirubrobacterales bacterium]
ALWLLGAAPAGEPVGAGRRKGARARRGKQNTTGESYSGAQLALPIQPQPAPVLRRLSDWEAMIADYGATGLTTGVHPLALLRPRLRGRGVLSSAELDHLPENTTVRVGGLVVARQRPGTAKGVVFVLLEDETGVVNIVLPPKVYERFRVTVRSEPLLTIAGKVERRTGALNVIGTSAEPLIGPGAEAAAISAINGELAATTAGVAPPAAGSNSAHKVEADAADLRAVAPVGINFGRRGR